MDLRRGASHHDRYRSIGAENASTSTGQEVVAETESPPARSASLLSAVAPAATMANELGVSRMLTYPPDLEDYVRQKIETGQFHSRDALAIEAVRIYRELDTRFQALKAEIQVGLDEANRGEVEPLNLESIMQELREELDENGRPVR